MYVYLFVTLHPWSRVLLEKPPVAHLLKTVHYRAHKSSPLVPTLSQIDPVHTSLYISKIHFPFFFRF
jgi:hypothetical protein